MKLNTQHLILDGYNCDFNRLKSFETIYNFLNELPDNIKMTKLMQPYTIQWLDKGSKTKGITGFIIIAESHLSVHSFPDEKRIYVDVFSCKHFNVKYVENYFKKIFKPKKINSRIVR